MLLHNEFSLLPQQEADPTAPRACHGNILVMDDQESLCEIAQANLSYVGYSVTVAAHGKAVIELYQKALSEQNPFDLFILDLIVPGAMGGLETLQELLKIDPSVKAIITSGYPNNQILLEPHKHGFKGMLAKPYLKEELREMVRQTIMACNLPPPVYSKCKHNILHYMSAIRKTKQCVSPIRIVFLRSALHWRLHKTRPSRLSHFSCRRTFALS